MLEYQKLSNENYCDVLKIKHELFPESNSDEDYIKYFNKETNSNYYLITKDNVHCGTIGWYEFDKDNAFVGWFGVLPEFQGKGFGTQILNYIINEIACFKYKYLRVYTDKIVNNISTKLYDKLFDIKENYTYPDKLGLSNNFVVYTKFLKQDQEKWNNRPLHEDENYDF